MRDWSRMDFSDINHVIKQTGEWRRTKGFETGWENFSEKLMLIVTEGDEAVQARDAMVLLLDDLFRPEIVCPLVVSGNGFSREMVDHIENYIEEWTDVIVRLFDLMEACDIPAGELPVIDRRAVVSCSDLIEHRAYLRLMQLVRQISIAMEGFRDVALVNGEPNRSPDTLQGIRFVRLGLWAAVQVAIQAISDVGRDWVAYYRHKMEVNEGRPSRHGRQR